MQPWAFLKGELEVCSRIWILFTACVSPEARLDTLQMRTHASRELDGVSDVPVEIIAVFARASECVARFST